MCKQDFTGEPTIIIPLNNGGYKFYPMNIDAVDAFLENELRLKFEEQNPYYKKSGAV